MFRGNLNLKFQFRTRVGESVDYHLLLYLAASHLCEDEWCFRKFEREIDAFEEKEYSVSCLCLTPDMLSKFYCEHSDLDMFHGARIRAERFLVNLFFKENGNLKWKLVFQAFL